MKITKEHVGKRVKSSEWKNDEYVRVLAVGETRFFAEHSDLGELLFLRTCPHATWELLPDPKPLRAQAFFRDGPSHFWQLSSGLFSSTESAVNFLSEWKYVRWPALIDPNTGMYILPED